MLHRMQMQIKLKINMQTTEEANNDKIITITMNTSKALWLSRQRKRNSNIFICIRHSGHIIIIIKKIDTKSIFHMNKQEHQVLIISVVRSLLQRKQGKKKRNLKAVLSGAL